MANNIQLNLPPILERQREHLTTHFEPPLQEYYNRPHRISKILTVYVNTTRETSVKPSVCGAILSMTVSWLVGCKKKEIIESGLMGAAGGAFINSLCQMHKIRADIQKDAGYKKWKKSIREPVLRDFRQIISSDARFEIFRCAITKDFPDIPVRDSFGRLYDQEAIFKWIDEKGTNPATRERMTKDDVTFCPQFALNLKILVKEAFGSPEFMSLIKESGDEIVNGLKNLLDSSIKNHNEIIFAAARNEMHAAIADRLSPEEVHARYQKNIRYIINDVPEAPKPSGFAAIILAESIDDLSNVVFNGIPRAIAELGSELITTSAHRTA